MDRGGAIPPGSGSRSRPDESHVIYGTGHPELLVTDHPLFGYRPGRSYLTDSCSSVRPAAIPGPDHHLPTIFTIINHTFHIAHNALRLFTEALILLRRKGHQ